MPRIALTAGEPAGIGPDIIVQAAQQQFPAELVVFGSADLLLERAHQLQLPLKLRPFEAAHIQPQVPQHLSIVDIPLAQPVVPGVLAAANAPYVLEVLRQGAQSCLAGLFAALVTAPVHKGILQRGDQKFSGHTEFFAECAQVPEVVMMLASAQMRVALVTTHLPLSAVPAAVTPARLTATLQIVHQALQQQFNIAVPQIWVAGLNPHAGEEGQLGHEEQTIITPVLNTLRAQGMQLTGPLPADTLFLPKNLLTADAFVVMYHDQGLPVLKFADFAHAVNVTLGLPFVRTSVDHGTALPLAATGQADPSSLLAAIEMALQLSGGAQ